MRALKFGTVFFFIGLVLALPAAAQSLDALRMAEAWRVDYEILVTGSAEDSYSLNDSASGKPLNFSVTRSFESSLNASILLDLRNDGEDAMFGVGALAGLQSGAAPSVADALALSQAMFEAMESTANWQSTGGALDADLAEDASFEETVEAGLRAASAGAAPASMSYERVTINDQFDNRDERYKHIEHVTAKGAGDVVVAAALGAARLQLETGANKFRLAVPQSGRGDVTGTMIEVITVDRAEYPNSPPEETQSSRQVAFGNLGEITIDDAAQSLVGELLIVGDIVIAGGKLSGERTVPVHVKDDQANLEPIPGTLKVRYTLTPQP